MAKFYVSSGNLNIVRDIVCENYLTAAAVVFAEHATKNHTLGPYFHVSEVGFVDPKNPELDGREDKSYSVGKVERRANQLYPK